MFAISWRSRHKLLFYTFFSKVGIGESSICNHSCNPSKDSQINNQHIEIHQIVTFPAHHKVELARRIRKHPRNGWHSYAVTPYMTNHVPPLYGWWWPCRLLYTRSTICWITELIDFVWALLLSLPWKIKHTHTHIKGKQKWDSYYIQHTSKLSNGTVSPPPPPRAAPSALVAPWWPRCRAVQRQRWRR